MMEQVPDTFPSLFVGYTVIWVIVFFYVWSLSRRISRVERELKSKSSKSIS